MDCVVCKKPIVDGQEQYANAWERSRKRFPCCTPECCKSFNVDHHWMPAVLPRAASVDDEERLQEVFRNRLRDGDRPTVVLHEMLVAGVSPAGLRKIPIEGAVASDRTRQTAKELSIAGAIVGILTGYWSIFKSRDKREAAAMDEALADLDRWEERWRGQRLGE